MITLGPYAFSGTDARRTVASFPQLWAWLAEGRNGAVIEPLRPKLTGDTAADLRLVWAALLAAGPALRTAGQLSDRATGTVRRLSVSDGGVPKSAVDRVTVDWGGMVGDRQASRVHHGRPWQALCLWSSEVIAELRGEGHPITAGAAGENVTISGLPWAEVRAGARVRVGSVLCEVSAYTLPCTQNARWFRHGDFSRMHHDRGPVSRVYATVIEPGAVVTGDAAVLEP